ncbi:MAG: hypothetical protein ABI723_06885 [Bacteroidia bacterium]
MRHKLIPLLLNLVSAVAYGQQYDSTYGKPLIVLSEASGWPKAETDVPSFALYENGQIIYKQIENKHLRIYEVTLSKIALQNVIQLLGITDTVYKLPNNITAGSWSCMPINWLIINFDSTKIIRVYGGIENDSEARANTPKQFLTVYDNIKKYKSDSANEWLPDKIEVNFSRYPPPIEIPPFFGIYWTTNKRPWIPGFPDLHSPTTVKRRGGIYYVYIDKKDYGAFKTYYSSMEKNQAVEINGKKMFIGYRLAFPNLETLHDPSSPKQ